MNNLLMRDHLIPSLKEKTKNQETIFSAIAFKTEKGEGMRKKKKLNKGSSLKEDVSFLALP